MPKSHFPPHAGPYPPAWTADAHSPGHAATQQRNRAEVEAEIERLRQELAHMRADEVEMKAFGGASRSVRMLWCAIGLCGAAVLFAAFALLHHG